MSCAVRVGALIAHPCGRKGTPCPRCGTLTCSRHYDAAQRACVVCTGAWVAPTATLDLAEFGDPLDFAPPIFQAFHRRAASPDDELTGVDS